MSEFFNMMAVDKKSRRLRRDDAGVTASDIEIVERSHFRNDKSNVAEIHRAEPPLRARSRTLRCGHRQVGQRWFLRQSRVTHCERSPETDDHEGDKPDCEAAPNGVEAGAAATKSHPAGFDASERDEFAFVQDDALGAAQ